MCDCYETKCDEQGCNTIIPVHITDFCTPRSNIQCFCKKHIKDDCAVFELTKAYRGESIEGNGLLSYPKHYKFGFRVIDGVKVIDFGKHYTVNKSFVHSEGNKHWMDAVVYPNIANWEWIK